MTLSLQYVFATRNAGIWAGMGVVAQTFVCAREIKMFHLSDLEDQTNQSVGRSGGVSGRAHD